MRIRVDSDELGESSQIKKFLILLGFDDKKYVFTCILGFVCALALSRIRVSSLVVFPAAAIVFAIGFSFGFVNGRPHKGLGLNGTKRRVKDESLRVYVKKLKNLVDLFDGVDVKVNELKNDIKKAIEYETVEVVDLEGYVDAVESIGGLVLDARNLVEECIDSEEVEKNLIQKGSRKKKEINNNVFDLFGFIGGFLRDNVVGSKSTKSDLVRRYGMNNDVNIRARKNSVSSMDAGNLNRGGSSDANRKTKLDDMDLKKGSNFQNGKMDTMEAHMSTKTSPLDEGLNYRSVRFMNNRRVSLNMSSYKEFKRWASGDNTSSNTEFDLSKPILQNSNGGYEYSESREFTKNGSYRENLIEERMNVYQCQQENDMGSLSSSAVSDDVLFDKFLTNANDLLKQAKECIKIRNDEMLAEEMLHESAKLLSKAIAMKPMSLLAIGQLGNTYLLHGELKFRISRELRRLLSRSGDFGVEKQSNLLNSGDGTLPNKDRIADLLINVCEECEALLVEAGRKYRTALAIDGNDLRALYNWGLALSFRAQLIADIGPEVALDADKLFLAAIDKFDAMMSRSNIHAPEALFRWGVALQQRSRLRRSNSKDKVKLLQQAKRLYEDALDMGSDSLQVREALSSCISELDFGDI